MTTPAQPSSQLALPIYGGAPTRTIKTSVGGTITDPLEQPARALTLYDDVIGVFRGEVTHAGGDATYDGQGEDAQRAPTHTQKITLAAALVPLSDETRRDLRNLIARIVEENHAAARRIGLVDENAEPKAS